MLALASTIPRAPTLRPLKVEYGGTSPYTCLSLFRSLPQGGPQVLVSDLNRSASRRALWPPPVLRAERIAHRHRRRRPLHCGISIRPRSAQGQQRSSKRAHHVRFSNRPTEVKRFQTIRRHGIDAHGLALLFGLGTRALPSWDSKTRWNNLLRDLAVEVTAGSSRHSNSPHPSSREGHHSTAKRAAQSQGCRGSKACCHSAPDVDRRQRIQVVIKGGC